MAGLLQASDTYLVRVTVDRARGQQSVTVWSIFVKKALADDVLIASDGCTVALTERDEEVQIVWVALHSQQVQKAAHLRLANLLDDMFVVADQLRIHRLHPCVATNLYR